MKEIRIYQPDQNLGWGLSVWQEMLRELKSSKELIWRLFIRDFKAKYKQTVLGFLWALIMPFVLVGTFVFLNRAGILNIGKVDIAYPAYALLGLTIWHIFARGLLECSNSIVAGRSMITKINFPKEALVFSSFGQTLVEVLVRFGLTVLIFACYQVVPAWTSVFFPFAIIPLFLFTLGLGLFLSMFNALLRDVSNIISLGTTFLLFVTPVLYPEPSAGFFKEFTLFNPLAALISGPRDLVIKGYLTQPVPYAVVSVFSLIVFLVGWRVFHLAEVYIAERIGTR